ncbi:phospholipase D-like domain-containing protein [Nonomuraea sp. NEAU-A123]|uniref:phospholipase D-like domain-containing protein n=1 Tax=Nonomuraea sp. NEAU-A123 TaxID=2839649 RepID=UPI001BE3EA6B|nr:phospholipase D-like domain-containing protein [Nonomuraea sp. NEAU-A123]MBT2225017.1 phospholipase [Nonomuraea sp. NEAU-A123]
MPEDLEKWLLTTGERGNPATLLDSRHADHAAWSTGNHVRPLVHGASYFAVLVQAVDALRAGDLLLFTDWRGDADECLTLAGRQVTHVLGEAAARGVMVKGLIWRSHLDQLQFSERENRKLSEDLSAAGGECLLDMRVRPGGSHHQKFVVLRHPGRPERDVAFVGGIDLCHGRHDDDAHAGDRQSKPIAAVYGNQPPWHDIQVEIRGPAVGDVEAIFRERWDDPAPLTRNPMHRIRAILEREDIHADPMPPQLPDPAPCGSHTVQLLRTYASRRRGYAFAPEGERSIARGYLKVLGQARSLIYLEDQYLWSAQVARPFAEALAANPGLHLIAVIPRFPDLDGRFSQPPNVVGHNLALDMLFRGGGARVSVYGIENHDGTPVYVHAKACTIDDVWATVGSDNLNLRSWTHDSELSCAVLDEQPDPRDPRIPGQDGQHARVFARELRLTLNREHLDRAAGDDSDLQDPLSAFKAFAESAAALDTWHAQGQQGPRPPGRLRTYQQHPMSWWTRTWATPLYRHFYDPDGRPSRLRRTNTF